ncbi:CS1-pili formation C-terminal domain-containing protein [uncultured Stenotrophomonas sp.]|uniref:CS1-pili formation C-terminal domain-containing protein n=1 Tax=uncultured Stenotrophomonas sp. TaxID=165438 RepID=UPI0028E9CBCE|nr:CS1-pili formation C-terminal domain-containing protein [uncultured Stenotrophomonas sp.]
MRTEIQPFSRGQAWGEPGLQWFVQGGREQAHARVPVAGQGALQAGLRLPLTPHSGASLGVARIGDRRYAELRSGTRHRVRTHDLQAEIGAIAGSDGSRGSQQQLNLRNRASWNLYRQRMRGARCRPSLDADNDRLGCADALSASLSLPLAGGSLYLGHTRRRSAVPAGSGVVARLPERSRSVQMNYSLTRQWRGMSVSARLGAWRQDSVHPDQGVQFGVAVSRLRHAAGSSVLRRFGVEARQPRHAEPERSMTLARSWRQEQDGSAREAGAEVALGDRGDVDALLALRAYTPLGHTGAVLSHFRQADANATAYSVSHGSALALSRRGLFWGSASGADAGVAVSVAEADLPALDGAAAEVQAGAQQRQVLRFGQRRLLPLSSYQRHRVDVHDVANHVQDAGVRVTRPGTAHQPFLLPGRVIALPVGVETTFTYIGSARDAGGSALAGARILNAAAPPLGHDGGFMAEFPQREAMLYLLLQEKLLQCPLQVREQRSVVLLVGPLACAPLARDALPERISQQPRVQQLLDGAPIALGRP